MRAYVGSQPLSKYEPKEVWRMRRLSAREHAQLWHIQVDSVNGYYVTACGRKFGIAGSSSKSYVPASACIQCLNKS